VRSEWKAVGCDSCYLVISGHFVRGKQKLNKRNEDNVFACFVLRYDGKGNGMKAQCLGFCSPLCCLHTVPYEHMKIKVYVILLVWMLELSV